VTAAKRCFIIRYGWFPPAERTIRLLPGGGLPGRRGAGQLDEILPGVERSRSLDLGAPGSGGW